VGTLAPPVDVPTTAAAIAAPRHPGGLIMELAATLDDHPGRHTTAVRLPGIAALQDTGQTPLLPGLTASGMGSAGLTKAPVRRQGALAPATPPRNRIPLVGAGPTVARLAAHHTPGLWLLRTRPA
jgi:hypothetical protein